jgi:hypothetical protein
MKILNILSHPRLLLLSSLAQSGFHHYSQQPGMISNPSFHVHDTGNEAVLKTQHTGDPRVAFSRFHVEAGIMKVTDNLWIITWS